MPYLQDGQDQLLRTAPADRRSCGWRYARFLGGSNRATAQVKSTLARSAGISRDVWNWSSCRSQKSVAPRRICTGGGSWPYWIGGGAVRKRAGSNGGNCGDKQLA